jgi:hypothetical protein
MAPVVTSVEAPPTLKSDLPWHVTLWHPTSCVFKGKESSVPKTHMRHAHCTPLTTGEAWTQPWHSPVNKGKVVYRHSGILFSQKEEILPFSAKWMKLLREMSQTQRDKFCTFSLKCRS